MSNFYGGQFFGGGFFGDIGAGPTPPAVEPSRTGGKGDNKYTPVKPTGLRERISLKKDPSVEERVRQARQIQSDVASQIAREFGEETAEIERARAIEKMSLADVEREIGTILRKKVRTEEDELNLLVLMAALL